MATYWNSSKGGYTGYTSATYCYGYYKGQYYSSGVTIYTEVGNSGSSWDVYPAYVASYTGNYDWGCDNGSIYLRLGNSSGGWGWHKVNAKTVYTIYCDSESSFEYSTSESFTSTGSSVTTTIVNYSDIGLSSPTGKRFKEWNTSSDGSGTAYSAGDTFSKNASDIDFYKEEVTLYAIWEWDGVSNIGGKNAICYICTGHNKDNSPIWQQALPYVYCKNSEGTLGWRMGVGGSS